jgi:hypothetical protein
MQEFFIQRAQQGHFERVMVSASIINQLIIAPVSFRSSGTTSRQQFKKRAGFFLTQDVW